MTVEKLRQYLVQLMDSGAVKASDPVSAEISVAGGIIDVPVRDVALRQAREEMPRRAVLTFRLS